MAQWLYRIVPARPGLVVDATPEEEQLVGEHFAYLVALRDLGILILAGRTQETEGSFGIAIYEADDEERAREIMNADPAIAAGAFLATLHPYRMAVTRGGIAG